MFTDKHQWWPEVKLSFLGESAASGVRATKHSVGPLYQWRIWEQILEELVHFESFFL